GSRQACRAPPRQALGRFRSRRRARGGEALRHQRARPGACGARRSRQGEAGRAARRLLQCRVELRRPAPSDERRVQFHRRTVRRQGPSCPNDGWRRASAPQRTGRGRSRVRDRGLNPVNAPSWLIERPIAHRGLHDSANGVIENTLRAAEAAIAGGFAIECDIQLSADGEAIVFHDETLDRLTDATGPLSALTANDIAKLRIKGSGEPPPTFVAFLDQVAGRTPIICELKSGFNGHWSLADRAAALA